MTDAEAEALLAQLSAHYRQPVMPVRRYCEAITTWLRAIERSGAEGGQGAHYHQHLRHIERDISKSNLLARLIYGGETLREVPCPAHQGHYSGSHPIPCGHGCGRTGWLPAPHAYEPVKLMGWGKHPERTVCQRCGGLEAAEVHGLTPEDRLVRRAAMATYRQCAWCKRDGTTQDTTCAGCGQAPLELP